MAVCGGVLLLVRVVFDALIASVCAFVIIYLLAFSFFFIFISDGERTFSLENFVYWIKNCWQEEKR